jgi:histidinol dehydrogenase
MKAAELRRLSTTQVDFRAQITRLTAYEEETNDAIEHAVAAILRDVKARGDAAVLEYTNRFDKLNAQSVAQLEVPRDAMRAALDHINKEERAALEKAAERIRSFHLRQKQGDWTYFEPDGTVLGQRIVPLDRVGLYAPGGLAAYPSSVLMNAVPAKVAGVGELIMVSPNPGNVARPMVLAAAYVGGVDRLFSIGGAQAVAALAYGTQTIPPVDKITGPGNAYVAAAKRRVFGTVGIDMIAGPSEILVIADGSTPADWVAMDLFSQAEHDVLAQSILLSDNAAYLDEVAQAIECLLPTMPRKDVIEKSLRDRGAFILAQSLQEACEVSNWIAPEHMELSVKDPQALLPHIKHAGAIFMGAYSSESLGDYCAGPNHVLPTMRTARFSSPLGVYDFVKRSSIIYASSQGAQTLGPVAGVLADNEGLPAHAAAARMRLHAVKDAAQDAAQRAQPKITLRDIDAANCDTIGKLKVAGTQSSYIANNWASLAQVSYKGAAGSAYAIYAGETPVGLTLLWDSRIDPDEEDRADQLYIWRMMIDEAHQNRGYGKQAIALVIEKGRAMGVERVALSHVPGNDAAAAFYQRMGFVYTGQENDGELEMVLALK